jgi:hypothetical protein
MNEALGLSWTIARTATEFTPRASLSQNRGGWSGPDLLEVVAAELPELVRPIRISRALNVTRPVTGPADTASRAGAFDTLLTIEPDATSTSKATLPLLVVARADANTGPDTDPAANLATFASGTNASSGTSSAGGLVALLTVAPDLTWTDLPAKPLMVPLVQELVRQGIGRSMASRITAAGQAPLLPPGTRDLAPVRIALLDEAQTQPQASPSPRASSTSPSAAPASSSRATPRARRSHPSPSSQIPKPATPPQCPSKTPSAGSVPPASNRAGWMMTQMTRPQSPSPPPRSPHPPIHPAHQAPHP